MAKGKWEDSFIGIIIMWIIVGSVAWVAQFFLNMSGFTNAFWMISSLFWLIFLGIDIFFIYKLYVLAKSKRMI